MTPSLARVLIVVLNVGIAFAIVAVEYTVFMTDPRTVEGAIVVPIVDERRLEIQEDAQHKGIAEYAVIPGVLGYTPPPPPAPVNTGPKEPPKPPTPKIEQVFEVAAVLYTDRYQSCLLKRKRSKGGGQSQASPGDELDGFELKRIERRDGDAEEYRIVFLDKRGGQEHAITFRPPP